MHSMSNATFGQTCSTKYLKLYRVVQEHLDSHIYGQTVTTDHHDELINMGIKPSLTGTNTGLRFPYVIFCAPPSRTPDYPGDVRLA